MGTGTSQGGGSQAGQPCPKAAFQQASIRQVSASCASSPLPAAGNGSCISSARN